MLRASVASADCLCFTAIPCPNPPLFPCLLLPFQRRCLSPFPPRSPSLLNPHTAAAADETTGPLRPGCLENFKTNNIYSSQILRAKTLVEKLAMLPLAAQPTKVDPAPSKLSRPFTGSPWRRPVFSRRQLAVLKKEATAAGLEWPMPEKEVRSNPRMLAKQSIVHANTIEH